MSATLSANMLLAVPLAPLAGAVLAVAAVWRAFRRHGPGNARTAVLAAATFLVSPYTLNYDLLLLMPAAVALFRHKRLEAVAINS